MYTTPRKVKQESRLRRTHSLNTSLAVAHLGDDNDNSGEEDPGTLGGSFEDFSAANAYIQILPGAIPAASSNVSTNSQGYPSTQQSLKGTTIGASDSTVYCSRARLHEGHVQYQTHSGKFPIVREVTLRTSTDLKSPAEDISVRRNNFLEKSYSTASKILEQDVEKALTLDSSSAKEIQNHLRAHSARYATRRNSLDLEKFIQVFNEEQILMSSLQGGGRQLSGSVGVEVPNLDLTSQRRMFDNYHGNSNGGTYYNDSNSSNSLSLSSSTADSLDTVIYKTPLSSQPSPSRNWRGDQIFEASTTTSIQMEQQQSHTARSQNNGYLETNNQFQDHHHSTQFQQGQNQLIAQQRGGSNNNNNFGAEYRSVQNQQHLQQMQHLSLGSQKSHQSSQNGPGTLRTGNGPTNGVPDINAYTSQSQAQSNSTQSPFTKQKSFGSVSNNPLDKTKDSTKLFPTKTYNHIKDMISSRFGNPGSGPPNLSKGVLDSANNSGSDRNLNNTSNNSNGIVYNNALADATIGLPTTSYNPNHHHHQSNGYALQVTNGHGPPYYVVPQNSSSETYSGPTASGGSSFPSNTTYRSPQMSERKDVNTSFRKAIQQSTQKSNLTEQSLQLRKSVTDLQHFSNHESTPQHFQNGYSRNSLEFGSIQSSSPSHVDRANRALDKLLDPDSNSIPESSYSTGNHNRSFMTPSHDLPTLAIAKSGRDNNTSRVIPHSVKTLQPGSFPFSNDPSYRIQTQSVQNAVGLPPVPLVRENGDGSSVVVDGISKGSNLRNNVEDSDAGTFRPNGLHVLDVSPGTENVSSSSECEVKGGQRVGSGQSHTTTDSGLGTMVLAKSPQHSSNMNEPLDGLLGHHVKFNDNVADSISSGNDSEWVDIVEPEIRQILELERLKKTVKLTFGDGQNGGSSSHPSQNKRSNVTSDQMTTTQSIDKSNETIQHDSPIIESSSSPQLSKKFDLTTYNKKSSHEVVPGPSTGQGSSPVHAPLKSKANKLPSTLLRSNSGTGHKSNPWPPSSRQRLLGNDKGKSGTIGRNKDLVSQTKVGKLTRNAMSQILYSLNDDGGDMTSTTGGLDLESMLDARGGDNSSEDDDLSTTIDTTDAHAIRRQLESLESMYTEVLKVLGGKKPIGSRHPPPVSSDLRHSRRRAYGSMSSLPSSVSSRPFRENRKRIEEKKKVKDIKSISRRFQRLESHVVTLARSVAHLSSEMRTQHLMVQEMESVRNELTQLRNQVLKSVVQNQSAAAAFASNGTGVVGRGASGRQGGVQSTDWTTFRNALPSLTNPCRVRKLTKFFGDEPPLIRIFLKKLGYEKYAFHFEQERIGIMELPYLTEDRLQKMGIPMGPRLRILQEAHQCLKPGSQFTVETQHNGNAGNLSVYVV